MSDRIKNERGIDSPEKTEKNEEEDKGTYGTHTKDVSATDNKDNKTQNKKNQNDACDSGGVDKLDLLFKKQGELFKKNIGDSENKMKNLYHVKEPFDGYRVFMLSTALVHEAIELQRETNWKWWKKESTVSKEKIHGEIIDIWHFLIQISIESGLDSKKIVEKYIEKNEENLKRQLKGY
jgi:dimeric dUTPase (all-alpha-NTP-PPase superfamily)